MRRIVVFILVFIMIFSSTNLISGIKQQDLMIHFDCRQTNETIHYFSEINCGPLPNHDNQDGVDITKQYQKIGIDFIRTHDFNGPTDVSYIFPDFSADPSTESNYNFTLSDKYISSIIDAGCQVFYRLGESAGGPNEPPLDFNKWAEICKHIIMHYNDGWADGYHYNIKYFEIWNEPDLSGFFNGTVDQYYELYHTTAIILKDYDSSLKIGGPCTSSIYNNNFTTGFLSYVLEFDIPLDFYSWHMYTNSPFQLYSGSLLVRSMLDSYGLIDTENINTEWNIDILAPQRDKDNAKNAAFTACTFTTFHDSGIDYAFRYRGTGDNSLLTRFIGFDLSLISYDGMFKTPTLIYKLMNIMEMETPLRLKTPEMNASSGLTYLGGISEDQSNISILVSNFDAGNQRYFITIDNIPWNESYSVIHYVIDDDTHFEIKEKIEMNSSFFEFSDTIHSSTVHFFWLTNTSVIPDEGPETKEIPFWMRLKILDPLRRLCAILLLLIFFG